MQSTLLHVARVLSPRLLMHHNVLVLGRDLGGALQDGRVLTPRHSCLVVHDLGLAAGDTHDVALLELVRRFEDSIHLPVVLGGAVVQ